MGEKEYIEREALDSFKDEVMDKFIELCRGNDYNKLTLLKIGDTINSIYDKHRTQPASDVVEVRRGEWVDKFNRNRMATQSFCSACGKHSGIGGIESNRHKPYCPNCGAKMDGKGEELC